MRRENKVFYIMDKDRENAIIVDKERKKAIVYNV